MTALKNLGLNIRRAKVGVQRRCSLCGARVLSAMGCEHEHSWTCAQVAGGGTTFYLTDSDTSEKIVKSARLEDIRQTVLNSLVARFPVSEESLCEATGGPAARVHIARAWSHHTRFSAAQEVGAALAGARSDSDGPTKVLGTRR